MTVWSTSDVVEYFSQRPNSVNMFQAHLSRFGLQIERFRFRRQVASHQCTPNPCRGPQCHRCPFYIVDLVEKSMGFDSWLSWWFNQLPGKPIYSPKKDTYAQWRVLFLSDPQEVVVLFAPGRMIFVARKRATWGGIREANLSAAFNVGARTERVFCSFSFQMHSPCRGLTSP